MFSSNPSAYFRPVAYTLSRMLTVTRRPVAVGAELPDMPLFITEEYHIPVPLEATYQTTWGVPPPPLRDLFAPAG